MNLYADIMAGLEQAIEYEKGNVRLKTVKMTMVPNAETIAAMKEVDKFDKLTKFDDYLAEQLQNDEFRAEYEALEAEMQFEPTTETSAE